MSEPAAPEPQTLVLPAETVAPEAGEIVEATSLDGRTVCLARLAGGDLVAFEPRCPHRGAPLRHGALEGELVICLEHFWRWKAGSGEPVAGGHPCLGTYRVVREGEAPQRLPP